MIFHFILNPQSGRKRKYHHFEDTINKACKDKNIEYKIHYTTGPKEATEYVASMAQSTTEKQRFICVGGDGTLNELVNSAPGNQNIEFGIIPAGTGNDYVRNFTKRKNFDDINAQIDGEAIPVDLIKCNEYYCINMVNIGLDCEVVKEANRLKKLWFIPVSLSYIAGLIVVAFRKIGTKMKLKYNEGEIVEKLYTLTAIGKGQYCGGGFCALPKAHLDDGKLHALAIDKVSLLKFLTLVIPYKLGKHLNSKRALKVIKYTVSTSLKMEFEKETSVCIDGEIIYAQSVDLSLCSAAARFVIPKGSSYKHLKV